MKHPRLSAILLTLTSLLFIAAPMTYAGTVFESAALEFIGRPDESSTFHHEPFVLPSYPFVGPNTFAAPGYTASAIYDLNDAYFDSSFNPITLNSQKKGNYVETAGTIRFELTIDTPVFLSGFINVDSNLAVNAEVFGSLAVQTSSSSANVFVTKSQSGVVTNGTLLLPTFSGTLEGGHIYEFHYSAFIEARADDTLASALGDIRLDLGQTQSSTTPLPSVATAGVVLFGAMGLRRSRRARA
jgi:hypothetical protein